ncbi:flagellar basal-body protein FlbY [Brevundimonas sp.]|uniref:flagellar basal-body protein FlbY n=1 Tax=Brevundimonas sp. TaxID=1871086 RepID=UPI002489E23B|nr:flagellar basal-body protein FlbY [Brevundimonas sp.]MDI1281025.1 flagellar basal-body protein FlbY [Brevundimonas sp.]
MTPRSAAEEASDLNATGRLRQLITLTERLTQRLIEESRAFEARRPQDVAVGMAETRDLANLYRRESAQVKANPAVFAGGGLRERKGLIRATEAFEAVLARHVHAVEAARVISEGLVKAIAEEVANVRGSPSAYGSSGRAAAGDGRAVALNRTA